MNYLKHIELSKGTRFGKPCIKGTRISVYDILNWMASGMTKEQIIHDFPELNEDQILACLAFAAEKQHKIRSAI